MFMRVHKHHFRVRAVRGAKSGRGRSTWWPLAASCPSLKLWCHIKRGAGVSMGKSICAFVSLAGCAGTQQSHTHAHTLAHRDWDWDANSFWRLWLLLLLLLLRLPAPVATRTCDEASRGAGAQLKNNLQFLRNTHICAACADFMRCRSSPSQLLKNLPMRRCGRNEN